MRDKFSVFGNVTVIIAALFFLISPNGPIGAYVTDWTTQRDERALMASKWMQLQGTETRIGPEGAPVSMVEFIDYQCPYCRTSDVAVRALVNDGSIGVVAYRHLPLTAIHDRAMEAALAVSCATLSGEFERLHNYLLGTDSWYEVSDWREIVRAAGSPRPDEVVECMSEGHAAQRVNEDIALAGALGVEGTPAFVTPQAITRGAQTSAELLELMR
jgi:protein-disulfide isomerase